MNLIDFEVFPLPNDTHLSVQGQNQKNILVFYKKSEKEGEELDFLKKVLGAIQIDMEKDSALVSLAPKEEGSFSAFKRAYPVQSVLLFGVTLKQLGINFEIPVYVTFQLQDIQYIVADSLGTIIKNGQKKRQLWEALKKLAIH